MMVITSIKTERLETPWGRLTGFIWLCLNYFAVQLIQLGQVLFRKPVNKGQAGYCRVQWPRE